VTIEDRPVIMEIDLPPELAARLNRLADSAATGDVAGVAAHPELRRQTRNRLVAEALARWLAEAAIFDPDRGLRIDPARGSRARL
jgi:predicted transcriptional regulator